MTGHPFAVFVSYRQSGADGAFVRDVLVPRLEGEGVRTFVDYREFEWGAALIDEMARGVEQSRYTLALASPAYFASTFADLENVLAQHLGLEEASRRLLVAEREKCDLPLRMRAFLYLDWTSPEKFDMSFPRLVQTLRQSGESRDP
jgi:hypothetical protein